MRGTIVTFIAIALLSGQVIAAEVVSFESLLRDMVDRSKIAEFPDVEFSCKQASSYDRKSVTNNPDDGKFHPQSGRDWGKGWFANADFYNFIRDEVNNGRKEYVMLDHQGPGTIVRWWHAIGGRCWSHDVIIRVYLDRAVKPEIEMEVKDLVGGNSLVGAPFSYLASDDRTNPGWRGRNLYLPIPFQEHCKITMDDSSSESLGGWAGFYYQINYRTYKPGTRVTTFKKVQLKQAADTLTEVAAQLTSPYDYSAKSIIGNRLLKPSENFTHTLKGTLAIKSLFMAIDAANMSQARRSTVIEIIFDEEQTVWCPLDAFFGSGYTDNTHKTFFVENEPWYPQAPKSGQMAVRWVMPFQKQAIVTIHNFGDQNVTLKNLAVATEPWQWDNRSMYFHATWFELRNQKTDIRRDVNYVTIKGKGVYVGDSLTIFNTHPDWWGEGDEKIYVDGESFPSHFGTGTEDYYGYAWCRPQSFSKPFHSQPCGLGNKHIGTSTNNRYRSLDAIPFYTSLSVNMELWHPFCQNNAMLNFAPATFWYALPDSSCNIKSSSEAAQLPVARTAQDVTN